MAMLRPFSGPLQSRFDLTRSRDVSLMKILKGGGTVTQAARKRDDDGTEEQQYRELTHEEGAALFDQRARQWLGMSGDEFVRAWDAGRFDDNADRTEVMHVAMLLPLVK
ncbi:MAG: hypothetical protein NTZ05_18185 [Chloroflexi bacterium]|nr:hypothetical protein [Chloroflexota bacterium]